MDGLRYCFQGWEVVREVMFPPIVLQSSIADSNRTIAVAPTLRGEYPSFIVDDLSKDERFNQLPFVSGPPYLRFYAGVPLITKRGIPIGSLFIVDDRGRCGLSREEIHFMGTMACTIMEHMELVRSMEEHRRGVKMNRGLVSFVEGYAEPIRRETTTQDTEGLNISGQIETDKTLLRAESDTQSNGLGSVKPLSALSGRGTSVPLSQDSQSGTRYNVGGDITEPPTKSLLFSRAASIIREAFEVDGAVFYDAQRGFSNHLYRHSRSNKSMGVGDGLADGLVSSDEPVSSGEHFSDHDQARHPPPHQHGGVSGSRKGGFPRRSADAEKPVDILGISATDGFLNHSDISPGGRPITTFGGRVLHTFLRRYPRGKLWTFDSDGVVSSSDDDIYRLYDRDHGQHSKNSGRLRARSSKHKYDATFLSRHFRGVRQLLFIPLWDAGRSRWLSGCFAWSNEPTRILSNQSELAFLTAFGNSIAAESSRVDMEIADQMKGDFIGSISHELRSPLHGILASAEFLGDEVMTGFQKGLVETINSCGRTLLDTIVSL
jgi:hypothetical protein